MLAAGVITVVRFVLGLGLIALSIFLMVVKLGGFTFVPGIITLIIFSSVVDMEVLANFWAWEEDSVRVFLLVWVGTQLLFGMSDSEFVSNVCGGLCGIIAGILTMGVFGTEGAEILLEIVSLPAMAVSGIFLILILLFILFTTY